MTLLQTVRLLGIVLVAIACLPMIGAEELPAFIWALVGGGLIVGWFVGGKPWSKQLNFVFTSSLVAAFLLTLIIGFQTGDWLIYSIIFALLATVTRTLQHHTARQQFQLIALSFLLMVAGSVTNPGIAFAVYFLVYAVVMTWALTYTHLLQRVEEGSERSGIGWKASRLVTRRFLFGSSVLALALLMSSMVIFLLFPRLGLGFFSARTRSGSPLTGFSDSLELGHFGTLQDSSRVVMRVEFQSELEARPNIGAFRLRGIAFDTYDGRSWSRLETEERKRTDSRPLAPDQDGYYGIRYYPRLPQSDFRVVEYDIYLEPLDMENRVIFAAPRPLAIRHLATRFDRWRGTAKTFQEDRLENLSFKGPASTSTSYTVRSGEFAVAASRLRQAGTEYPLEVREHYLQLPEQLDPRIISLAAQAAGDADNPYDVSVNVADFLAANYGYSLTGEGIPVDPLATFLFERREGHCEYFATSMVILLRTLGIPARPVNGFLGGTYNEFGDYYTITDARAHSWVEVYLGDFGWYTFDPTPAAERLPESQGFFATLELWLDALKLRWYKWVVEYDLEKQLEVYSKVWNVFASKRNQIDISSNLSISEMRKEMKKMGRGFFSRETALWVSLLILLGLLPAFIRAWRRRRRKTRRSALDRLAHRLRITLKAKGFNVLPGTTLPALVREGISRNFAATPALAQLTARLEEARWSDASLPDLDPLLALHREVAASPKVK